MNSSGPLHIPTSTVHKQKVTEDCSLFSAGVNVCPCHLSMPWDTQAVTYTCRKIWVWSRLRCHFLYSHRRPASKATVVSKGCSIAERFHHWCVGCQGLPLKALHVGLE